jgi:RNA polymerase sigma factor (sigma-70 family)
MEISNFQRYSADLDATDIEHKTPRQLAGLLKEAQRGNQKAWHDLWMYGTKLVLKICNSLRRADLLKSGFEEAVAEGNLAIGEALTRWNPKKSSFGTWVWIRIRGAVLDQDRKAYLQDNEVSLSVAQVDREGVDVVLDGLNQEYDTPFEEPAESIEPSRLRELIALLPEREYDFIVMHYFEGPIAAGYS